MDKIVLIDDDPDIRLVGRSALEYAGYEVYEAGDGLTGLRIIREKRPSVVLLDLVMPGMHGFTVCQEIRKDPELHATKIIVCSAKSYPADIKKAKEMGADDYLLKPYPHDELLTKVRMMLDPGGPEVTVKFWGTRGSIPTPGFATMRYGGNTSCVEMRCGDEILMMDCGTGAREMGISLAREFKTRELKIHMFMSHTHWDHIQGFPFFLPAYMPSARLTLYSLHGADKSLEKVFTGQMDASYFPVSLNDLSAHMNFVELDGPVKIGAITITHMPLNHPGIAIGFRIQVGKKTIAYVTDHEAYHRVLGPSEHNRKLDREVTNFAAGADLYIREAQYTDEEYAFKRGWGHSTFFDALDSAHEGGVKQLALYHHEPMHDDETLDRILVECHQRMREKGMNFKCFIAADNMQVTI